MKTPSLRKVPLDLGLDEIREHKHAEERLLRNHDTFFTLIQNNPFGVYLVDADFRLRQVSLGAQKVFENVRPLLGRDFAEVLRIVWPEPFAGEAIGRFRHTLETGEAYTAPSTLERRHDSGQEEAYDWRIERVTLPDGRNGVVCYFYDLSERKRWERALREGERRLRLATEAAELGIWSWQPDEDHVIWENEWPYAILGLPLTEPPVTAARFAAEFVHPDDLSSFEEAAASTVQTGSPFYFEGRIIRRRDGEPRWIAFTGARMPEEAGQPVQVIGTIEDITARKLAEGALEEADRRKDRFLATLAHELRNPLAPIRYALELMKQAGSNAEIITRARATMERQVVHMVRLIDDLLDVSRISQDKLELKTERVELALIIDHAVEAARPDCVRAGHEVHITLPAEPIYLHADPVRLAQVFGNLLLNSCKYTRPGGLISLTAERKGSEVAVTVQDSGIGIPEEMLSRVFDLFTQVDRTSEQAEGGLGIGLSLVKRLVEMHSGTVTVESAGAGGGGSEFVVHLPVLGAEPKIQALEGLRGEPAAPAARRVLVVEDNLDSAESLAMLLSLTGNETEVAHDGVEAVKKAAAFRPQVILLDIGLPRMNGYEACRAIRGEPWGKDMVVVALTGWGQEEDRRKSKDAGFNAHMVKPVNPDDLMGVLAALAPPEHLPS